MFLMFYYVGRLLELEGIREGKNADVVHVYSFTQEQIHIMLFSFTDTRINTVIEIIFIYIQFTNVIRKSTYNFETKRLLMH